MAIATLSPWPTSPAATAAAVACLKAAIADEGEADEMIVRVGSAAAARVEREAPGAPAAVKSEATIRLAGYLYSSDFGAIRKETIGPREVEYVTNHANAWRNSGAAALLAPWKIRRAGVIG